MEVKEAEALIFSLEKHPGIVKVNREIFLPVLLDAKLSESSSFHEDLPDTQQLAEGLDRYAYFSLRRVLRNRNAENYRLSAWKNTFEAVMSAFGAYSSDVLTRKIRADGEIVDMMARNEHPFSLLAKCKTYDFGNSEGRLFVVTRPVLVIPGVKDIDRILAWEEDNTAYEEEVRNFFPTNRRIRREDYIK